MTRRRWTALAAALIAAALAVAALASVSGATPAKTHAKQPIVIGAAIDLTPGGQMQPFDAPALAAAKIEIGIIDRAGGVAGRMLVMKPINDALDPQRTKQAALQLIANHVNIGWVTCDVDFATPAIQQFLAAHLLTVSPCIGTDEMGPSRFGAAGKTAFSFGNAAQDEGAAAAQYAYNVKHWHKAVIVTDNLLRYFQDVCKAFSVRFKQLGGTVVDSESFKQGDKTIGSVASRAVRDRS